MICQFCGSTNDLMYLSDIKDKDNLFVYFESPFCYCKKCWSDRDINLKCEKCNNDYQAYTCDTSETEFLYICSNCKCDGKNCSYCEELITVYHLYNKTNNDTNLDVKLYFELTKYLINIGYKNWMIYMHYIYKNNQDNKVLILTITDCNKKYIKYEIYFDNTVNKYKIQKND